MPRFGIKAQFTLLSLGLISIPLAGLSYWEEIQKTALTAQARIQEIEAKAIATSLLATQQNIGELLAADEDSELNKHALSAPSVSSPLRLDGIFGDWQPHQEGSARFSYKHPVWLADPKGDNETAFSLRLAQSPQYLFVALDVRDDKVVNRKPTHLRLDYNDHIRLSYLDETQTLRRVIIPAEKEGAMASYYTDQDWEFGRDTSLGDDTKLTPSHRTNIQGYWRVTPEGYALEFRIPTSQLGTLQPQIRFAVVDIDDNPSYGPKAIVASLPKDFEEQLNPVELHAKELQRVIDQLKHTYARLWIYDSQGREWAFAQRDPEVDLEPTSFDSQCVRDALKGQIRPLHQVSDSDGKLQRLVVCYPITEDGTTLGAVVIDESADHVLAKEQTRVMDIAIKLSIAIAALVFVLFAYAFNLVRRISRLSEESRKSVDPHGRIERTTISASKNFPDEVGDLSRSLSTLLQKQQSYVTFLERMPQTLRHEIANPLNKLRTSIENLLDQKPELADDRYIQKIDSGIDQITRITMHLTEAASLESAIQEEALTEVDLAHFLRGYCANWDALVELIQEDDESSLVMGDSGRLEQLFDKLFDNAISFSPEGEPVQISVKRSGSQVSVDIENKGPLLPTENSVELFSPMLSTRSSGSNIHLGLGLHIAKLICDQHKATLSGKNKEDGSGVVFSVAFALI